MQRRTILAAFRGKLGLTREQMASKCKVNRNTYSQIEQGVTNGSLDFWYNLKKEFNLSLDIVWAMQYEGKE